MKALNTLNVVRTYVRRNRFLILASLVVLVVVLGHMVAQFLTGGSLALYERSILTPVLAVIRVLVYVGIVFVLGKMVKPATSERWWESTQILKIIGALLVFELLIVQDWGVSILRGGG